MSAARSRKGGMRNDGAPEAVEEVLAEAVRPHIGGEIAVGGGDDADVGLALDRLAEAEEAAPLDRAEELRLRGQGELAYLVEEQGAARGALEEARLGGVRAGERALRVAEELALDERVGDRGAVDGHERARATGRSVVDGISGVLLADARLAGDQDRKLGGRDGFDLPPHQLQRGTDAEHLRAIRVATRARELLDDEPALLGESLDGLDQARRVERRTGERTEGDEELLAEPIERIDRQRVCRQHADHLAAGDERTPETVVHLVERIRRPLDEAVERIGQRGVRGKAHGFCAPQDGLQPEDGARVRSAFRAPAPTTLARRAARARHLAARATRSRRRGSRNGRSRGDADTDQPRPRSRSDRSRAVVGPTKGS
jgi:hypothetical protein